MEKSCARKCLQTHFEKYFTVETIDLKAIVILHHKKMFGIIDVQGHYKTQHWLWVMYAIRRWLGSKCSEADYTTLMELGQVYSALSTERLAVITLAFLWTTSEQVLSERFQRLCQTNTNLLVVMQV